MKKAPVTAFLIIAITIAFLFQIGYSVHHYTSTSSASVTEGLFATFANDQTPQMRAIGALTSDSLSIHSYWRLFTAMFLHGGWLHLLLNMWALLQFGIVFEQTFGSRALIIVWIVSGTLASATSTMFLDSRISVGASGAIFGICGALLIMLQRVQWQRRLRGRLVAWSIATIVLGFASPHIDNAGHIGGLIGGLLTGAFLRAARDARPR
jgi:membrane associated rhomboid family serine protease